MKNTRNIKFRKECWKFHSWKLITASNVLYEISWLWSSAATRLNLIDSAEDVGLLVRKGIILNRLGEDAGVSNMINNFCGNIGDNYTCFGDISREINAHYESRFNHMKATLKLVYFPNILRGTATVAAAILLILTLIQTIKSFF